MTCYDAFRLFSGGETMHLAGDGNVGIGTTAPATNLHIHNLTDYGSTVGRSQKDAEPAL